MSQLIVPGHIAAEKTQDKESMLAAFDEKTFLEAEAERLKRTEENNEKEHSKEAAFRERVAESNLISIESKLLRKRKIESLIDKRESATSYIYLSEAEEAIEHVEKALGFEAPNTVGFYLTIKLWHEDFSDNRYRHKDGSASSILMTEEWKDKYAERARYQSSCGLVIGMGPDCYKDDERFSGPWCRIGDFVTFKMHNADQSMYKGFAVCKIPDDKIMEVIQRPDNVSTAYEE